MTDYWSGSITFTGLGSGTDFDSIIEATMEVESFRLNQMENWEAQWTAKLEIISDINTQLVTYQSTLEGMDTLGEFLVKSAVSEDSSTLGVSADADAQEGVHSVIVNQRAQNDIWSTSTGWSSTDDAVTASDATFSLTYGSTTLSISVAANTTLEGLVNRINNDNEMGNAVRASLINDGDEYHLQIRGLDLGADNTVALSDSGMAGLDSADFVRTQAAQNAQIKVDGYPPEADEWIERDTNTITDVLDGLTLSLYGVTYGESLNITVSTDFDAVVENIQAFIDQTNAIRTAISSLDDEASASESDNETTVFTQVRGNYGLDTVEQILQDILVAKGVGFMYYDPDTGNGDYITSFSSLGITTVSDENSIHFGLLEMDEETLREALEYDAEAVARLFVADNDGTAYSSDFHYESCIDGMTDAGEYDVRYTVSGGVITSASMNGHAAEVDGWQITGQYGQPEGGLAVEVDNKADGTYTGTVYLRQGKVNETLAALDNILDSESGILNIIEDSYEEIIDNNAEAMEREQARLDLKYERLVEMYAEVETLLGYYDDLSSSLESQIDDLE